MFLSFEFYYSPLAVLCWAKKWKGGACSALLRCLFYSQRRFSLIGLASSDLGRTGHFARPVNGCCCMDVFRIALGSGPQILHAPVLGMTTELRIKVCWGSRHSFSPLPPTVAGPKVNASKGKTVGLREKRQLDRGITPSLTLLTGSCGCDSRQQHGLRPESRRYGLRSCCASCKCFIPENSCSFVEGKHDVFFFLRVKLVASLSTLFTTV